MIEFIFCCTSMLFMAWVIVLKLREDTLKKEIDRLLHELKQKVDRDTGDANISKHSSHAWGHKPFWMK